VGTDAVRVALLQDREELEDLLQEWESFHDHAFPLSDKRIVTLIEVV